MQTHPPAPEARTDTPIDAETISATIRRALRLGSARPALDELTAAQEELRGHITLLLPLVHADQTHLPQDSVLAHTVAARLAGIAERAGQPLRRDILTAHSQVGSIARDCQYLLAMHTAAARP